MSGALSLAKVAADKEFSAAEMFGQSFPLRKEAEVALTKGGQKLISLASAIGTLFAKFKKQASASLFCYISMQVTLLLRAEDAPVRVIF